MAFMLGQVRTVVLMLGLTASGAAMAAWPDDKPVEVVVGFAAGGGTDVMARKLLPFGEKRLGGNARFVVLTKPGAGGEIAFTAIARAAPDAYSMGVDNVPGYNFLPMTRKTQYTIDEIRLVARVVDDPGVIVVRNDARSRRSLAFSTRCARRPVQSRSAITAQARTGIWPSASSQRPPASSPMRFPIAEQQRRGPTCSAAIWM